MNENDKIDIDDKDKKIEKIVIAFCFITCFGFFLKIVFF